MRWTRAVLQESCNCSSTSPLPTMPLTIFCLYSRAERTGQNRGTTEALLFISFQHQLQFSLKPCVHVLKWPFELYWISSTFAFLNNTNPVLKLECIVFPIESSITVNLMYMFLDQTHNSWNDWINLTWCKEKVLMAAPPCCSKLSHSEVHCTVHDVSDVVALTTWLHQLFSLWQFWKLKWPNAVISLIDTVIV